MYKISQIFSTLFFIGYFKWAPGTLASFFSIIIIVYLNNITNKNVFIFIFFCILLISLILIDIYSKSIKQHDAKEIVIDEFLGVYLIIIFSNNYKLFSNEYIKIFLIILFFRIFDIIKPFPANWVDRKMKNSYGIIIDDIIAGIYTIIILTLINVFI